MARLRLAGPDEFVVEAGIAAAKGLALPHSTPIRAACSFDALALTAVPQMPPECADICVVSDARRGEFYTALYDRVGRRTREVRIEPLEALVDVVHDDPIWFVSTESDRLRAVLKETLGGFASVCSAPIHPRSALLAGSELPLEPIYLREPEYKKITG